MHTNNLAPDEACKDFYDIIYKASETTIPQYKLAKYFPRPWWSKEVENLRNKREKLYEKYNRIKSLANLIAWKKPVPSLKF
jgi:hypothetical protein